jgi:hypothetical protein
MHHLKEADIDSKSLPAENGVFSGATSWVDDIYIDPVLEKRTMAKFDKFLMPQIALLNLITYLDRTNIGSSGPDT